ncbi:ATP-binding cassette domain-containing protein [Streptomyces sp. NPDC051776]|uniref:ATP-binding cassette domain-containing protein n=1 Tax=Streptomyces sp. NPDC051776 TaxID=3155414 RepID=UPI003437DADC
MAQSATSSVTCSALTFAWPDGTSVFEDFDLSVGPGRTGLIGLNGSGKSTLLRLMAGELTPAAGSVRTAGDVGYLPQNVVLDTTLRVDEALDIAAARAALHAIEAGDTSEARFLFRGARADRIAGTLSGGERFRASLASLMLAEPAPQLLMLDEPTNNLDMASVRKLTADLESYEGALLVASHDIPFLEEIGITRWMRLDGELTQVEAEDV